MQRFARAVNHDLEAVRHAITERWSNGLVEGQINRLKTRHVWLRRRRVAPRAARANLIVEQHGK
jgi:hypothetical protein